MKIATAGYPGGMADDVKLDLLELAHAAERLALRARACLAEVDRGDEPRLGLLRDLAPPLERELAKLTR